MKRAVSVLLMLALTVSLTACMSCENLRFKRVDRCFDDLRGVFKMSDVTSSAELIGRRKNRNGNWFIGSYTAQCENETGRDTVFGGVSARDRRIKVKAHIKNRDGQRGHSTENERKGDEIFARQRRKLRTRIRFRKRR